MPSRDVTIRAKIGSSRLRFGGFLNGSQTVFEMSGGAPISAITKLACLPTATAEAFAKVKMGFHYAS